jgi:hypothetical protein
LKIVNLLLSDLIYEAEPIISDGNADYFNKVPEDYKSIVLKHIQEILKVNRSLETAVWWNAILKSEEQGAITRHLSTDKDTIVPFMFTELATYMRHWVTPTNKTAYTRGKLETKEEINK